MALSGDETRVLCQIERCLVDDDPIFALRMAAGQRHMGLRAGIPFFRPLCLLLTGAALVTAVVLAGTLRGPDDAPARPTTTHVAGGDRLILVVEPR